MKKSAAWMSFCIMVISYSALYGTPLAESIRKVCSDTLSGIINPQVKIVWTRSLTDGEIGFPQSALGYISNEVLMGFDTDVGVEDTLLKTRRNYQKPLLCRNGKRFIFSDCQAKKMYLVSWDKTVGTPVEIGSGVAGALYYDKVTKKEYVIYSGDCTDRGSGLFGNCRVMKMNIDSLADNTVIFNQTRLLPVSATWLCISGDGQALGCIWQWNQSAGVYDLTKTPSKLIINSDGCWSTMPFDNTHRYIEQHQSHEGWELYDPRLAPGAVTSEPLGVLLPGGKGVGCNAIRMPSYSTDLVMYSAGMPTTSAGAGGRLKLVRTNSSLLKIIDSVTITRNLEDGFGDLWRETPQNSSVIKRATTQTPSSLGKLLGGPSAKFYTLTGRAVPREKLSRGRAGGIYIVKTAAGYGVVPASEITKASR